jgi:hypothetical protein
VVTALGRSAKDRPTQLKESDRMNSPASRETLQRRWVLAGTSIAAVVGLKLGYDAGVQISGSMWLGLAMAANAAVFGAFCVGLLADVVFKRRAADQKES